MILGNKMTMMLDNLALTIIDPSPKVEKFLHITESSVEMLYVNDNNYPTKTVTRRKRPIFNVLSEAEPRVIQTYQGLWEAVEKKARQDGRDPVMLNKCARMKPPRTELMHGLRFSQLPLVKHFLEQEKSGLLGAPTRYGKTYLLLNTLRAYPGVNTVVTVPGIDLVRQLYKDVKEAFPHRNVVLLGGGSRKRNPSEDITVASIDSLHKCDAGRVRLLLIDEPHACVTDSRMAKILRFEKARILGFGATLDGRFDGRDKLITGLIGPVLAERTYLEAVAEGAICPIVVLCLKFKMDQNTRIGTRDAAYNRCLFRNKSIIKYVAKICRELIPNDWQTLLFIKNEKQALLNLKEIGEEGTIAMAKRLTDKERKTLMEMMQSGDVLRCLATDIYAQGVTFPDIRVLLNLAGGGDNTTAIQKPGRLAEIRPGKSCGVVIDVMFDYDSSGDATPYNELKEDQHAWKHLVGDSRNRRKAYQRKGYHIRDVYDMEELSAAFKEFQDGTAVELQQWKK